MYNNKVLGRVTNPFDKNFKELKNMFNLANKKALIAVHYAVVVFAINYGIEDDNVTQTKVVNANDIIAMEKDLFILNEKIICDIQLFQSLLKMHVDILNSRIDNTFTKFENFDDIIGVDKHVDKYYREAIDEEIESFNNTYHILTELLED